MSENSGPEVSGAELSGDERRAYVRELFARIARRYDLMNTLMTGGMHYRWRTQAARIAATGPPGIALDIATGTGDFALALDRQPGIQSVVGLDIVPQMVQMARSKSKDRLNLVVGDALSLPFPDDTFCCATSGFGLRNMPDVHATLAELARVVQPGGKVVILEIIPLREDSPLRPLFRPYFHWLVPLAGQLVAGDRRAYTYLPRSVDRFLTREGVRELFGAAGLQDTGSRLLAFGTVAIHWGVVV